MNKTNPRGKLAWSRLHFLLRIVGLTGLLAAAVALSILLLDKVPWGSFTSALEGSRGKRDQTAGIVLLAGSLAAVAWLLMELQVLLLATGRRKASWLSSLAQVVLILGLLGGANYYSYGHFLRFDWTRDRQFTLPPGLEKELRNLSGETTVVVHLRHRMFGNLAANADARSERYEIAAEQKIVEKIRDLVEEFRAFGPQFKVVLLDAKDEGFEEKLLSVTEKRPALRKAIDLDQEDTIFFCSGDESTEKIQYLSFNDFYQLDKTASQDANDGKGNLVLIPQGDAKEDKGRYTHGAHPFARRVLNIDERKPRVLIAVIHPVLTSQSNYKPFAAAEAKRALIAAGFEVDDVILRKTDEDGGGVMEEGAAFTYDESRADKLERRRADIVDEIELHRALQSALGDFQKLSLKELTAKYRNQLDGEEVTERMRQFNIDRLTAILSRYDPYKLEAKLKDTDRELQKLKTESFVEKQRLPELKQQMARTLEGYDLIIIPRATVLDGPGRKLIDNRVHDVKDAQIEAIQEFLKAGKKSALVCFGPPLSRERTPLGPGGPIKPEPDKLEKLVADLGFDLSLNTVVFESELESYPQKADKADSGTGFTGKADIPAVAFDPRVGESIVSSPADILRTSMTIVARSLGKNQSLAIKVRDPRPVDIDRSKLPKDATATAFMWTDPNGTAEKDPFRPEQLQLENTGPKMSYYIQAQALMSQGLLTAGPPLGQLVTGAGLAALPPSAFLPRPDKKSFCIGAAIERTVPDDWLTDNKETKKKIRVAAIGNGQLFTDEEMTPAKERLLVNTCNWLVGRGDYLARDSGNHWQFPRLQMDETTFLSWIGGATLGPPAVFAYLGFVVFLLRRVR
jgi:hypothetical protein